MQQLIPNAKAQFIDQNGLPLASGTVGFYFPGTLNPKPTYQDAAGTIANTNPVLLDSRGQAIIWGSGVYRQIVKDASGVTIWDQITEDPNSGLIGNMTNARWVAGASYTDPSGSTPGTFVPGTTTTFNLPAAPGSVGNIWPYFDAAFQTDDQISSLDGTTLVFASAVPNGVQEVEVKIGTTVAIGTPGSGTVTDITIAANAAISSSKLSFLQAGAAAARRSIQGLLRETLRVTDYAGVDPTGATDSTTGLAAIAAYAAGLTNPVRIVFPAGTYKYSTSPNWAIQNAEIVAEGEVILDYTGTGNAVILDTGSTVNTFTYNVTFTGFIVQAPASAGHGFFVRSIHHSNLRDNRVQGCGTSSNAFEVEFAVCTDFSGCVASAGETGTGAWVGGQPMFGLHLTQRNAGETTSYCTIGNPIFEGIVGSGHAGILLDGALGNIFIGGTSEGCDHGIITTSASVQNRFFGIDLEANNTRDVLEQGQGNEYYSVDSTKLVTISLSSVFALFIGGNHQSIELPTGVRLPRFCNVAVNRSGSGGFLIGDTLDVCTAIFDNCIDLQTQRITPVARQKTLAPPAGPTTFNYTNNTPNNQWVTFSGGSVTSTSITRQGVANSLGLLVGGWPLAPGDTFSIAYSGAAPVMTLYSM